MVHIRHCIQSGTIIRWTLIYTTCDNQDYLKVLGHRGSAVSFQMERAKVL